MGGRREGRERRGLGKKERREGGHRAAAAGLVVLSKQRNDDASSSVLGHQWLFRDRAIQNITRAGAGSHGICPHSLPPLSVRAWLSSASARPARKAAAVVLARGKRGPFFFFPLSSSSSFAFAAELPFGGIGSVAVCFLPHPTSVKFDISGGRLRRHVPPRCFANCATTAHARKLGLRLRDSLMK